MDDENLNQGEEQNEPGAGDHSGEERESGKGGLMGGESGETSGDTEAKTGDAEAEKTEGDGSSDPEGKQDGEKQGDGEKAESFEVPEDLKEFGDEFVASFKAVAESIPADKRDDLAKLGEIYQKAMDAKSEQFWVDQNDAWLKEIEADKDIGGEKLSVTSVKVNKLLNTFDPDKELTGYLEKMNHQNCAPLFKFLARITPHFSEDDFVGGDRGKNRSDVPRHAKMGYNENDYR